MLQSSGRTWGVTMLRVCGRKGGQRDTAQMLAQNRRTVNDVQTQPKPPCPSSKLGPLAPFPGLFLFCSDVPSSSAGLSRPYKLRASSRGCVTPP